MLQFRLLK